MNARVLGLACGAILAASAAWMTGCSGASSASSHAASADTIRSANVALTIQDASGTSLGSGSGILIAPKLVLTAAHLVAGQSSWQVRTADGQTAHGSRSFTYDWTAYGSDAAHPDMNDVAVIYLDSAIDLPAYPSVASEALAAGAMASRIHDAAGTFVSTPAKLSSIASFPNAYVTDFGAGETLDTGGAVLNANNEIIGLVTGRGLTTGKLYIARADTVSSWVADNSSTCDSGGPPPSTSSSSSSSTGGLGIKTYTPPGTSSSSSSGSTSSSSSSGSTSSSSSSGSPSASSSSGSTSSSSGAPGCTNGTGDGNCYGTSCTGGEPISSSSSSSSGSSSSSSSSSSGSPSSDNGGDTSIDYGGCPGCGNGNGNVIK